MEEVVCFPESPPHNTISIIIVVTAIIIFIIFVIVFFIAVIYSGFWTTKSIAPAETAPLLTIKDLTLPFMTEVATICMTNEHSLTNDILFYVFLSAYMRYPSHSVYSAPGGTPPDGKSHDIHRHTCFLS